MTVQSSERPVKRGDLVVLVHTSRIATNPGSGVGSYETTQVSLGTATSVSRAGEVKAWCTPFSDYDTDPPSRPFRPTLSDRVRSVPASEVDMAAALAAYRTHVYPGHRQVRPYESLAELDAMLASVAVPR